MNSIRNDIVLVKELNIDIVRSAIRSLHKATKAELAAYTGISVVSCSKILNNLCAAGEVLATDEFQMPVVHGRAARVYQYNSLYSLVACVYFATDHGKIVLSSVVADLTGSIVEESSAETSRVRYIDILETVQGLASRYKDIKVCAIGLPGSVNNGVIKLCSFSELVGMPLQEQLQHDFPNLKIIVENDTNAAAYGLYREVGEETTIGLLFAPDGVCLGDDTHTVWKNNAEAVLTDLSLGAGFVAFGRILRGFSGFAGEVWSLPVVRKPRHNEAPITAEVISDVILSIVSILNPKIIALTGGYVTAELIDEVRRQCARSLDPQDIPTLLLRHDIHADYVRGLIYIALEQLSCGVQIVKKEI